MNMSRKFTDTDIARACVLLAAAADDEGVLKKIALRAIKSVQEIPAMKNTQGVIGVLQTLADQAKEPRP